MDNLNVINENLDKLVFDGIPLYDEDIYLENVLCDTLLTSGNPNDLNIKYNDQVYECKNKISKEKALEMCREFLENIDHKYTLTFEKLIKNNKIQFIKTKDFYENSYFDFTGEEEFIKVYLLGNINDVLTILHEFMHYTNSMLATEVTSYYTEAFSNFIELLAVDYIIENHPKYEKDALKIKRSIFVSIYEKNIETKIVIELLKKKIKGLNLSSYDIFELVKDINVFCDNLNLIEEALEQTLDSLYDDSEKEYISSTRDTIGLVLGCYMYQLSKNKKLYKEIFGLNDNLNKFYYDEVLTYLGLDIKDGFMLTEESIKILTKSYKDELKKLW